VLIPIPLSNVIPALTIVLFALAYLEEDGLLLMIAGIIALLIVGIVSLAVWQLVRGAGWLAGYL
jgi:hypothetical protein